MKISTGLLFVVLGSPLMTPAAPAKPAIGLIARYDFDQDSASLLIDKSGHGFNGKIQGQPVLKTSIKGQSLDFNGAGDYVELPKDSAFQLERFTVLAWIMPRSTAGSEKTI